MSTETGREVVGVSGRGEVVVVSFADNSEATASAPAGIGAIKRHRVIQGAITIGEYAEKRTALAIAKGLTA